MPEPTIENQIKMYMFNYRLLNRENLKKSKFFDYTENEDGSDFNFNEINLPTDINNIKTIGLQVDNKILIDGITIWDENEYNNLNKFDELEDFRRCPDGIIFCQILNERAYGRIMINNRYCIITIDDINISRFSNDVNLINF